MKKIVFLLQINFILIMSTTLLFGQETDSDKAKKHFDRGMAIIENAKSPEDFKTAIKEFENAKTYAPNWADVYYNLGLLFDKMEKYDKSIENLKVYLQLDPNADDVETVKSMINKIEYKAEQFLNPETLAGIWYWNRPKVWCEPRLEIRFLNGIIEARALYSEGTELSNELDAARDPGVYIAKGSFVPLIWDDFEGKLSIIDAPYFSCGRSVDEEMCPSKATFYLTRIGENTLEGELTTTEKSYRVGGDNSEIVTFTYNVVFERDEE